MSDKPDFLDALAKLAQELSPVEHDTDYADADGMHSIIAGYEWYYGSPESCQKLLLVLTALPRLIELARSGQQVKEGRIVIDVDDD